jgi:N-hydroxyarylamine O-acetyltransferase
LIDSFNLDTLAESRIPNPESRIPNPESRIPTQLQANPDTTSRRIPTPMNLSAYLTRIGFTGDARPDLQTLRRIHRLHLEAIPYENLDVQLQRPLGFELAAHFEKLVHSRRGGWCYEMNGLLGWTLERIGFQVQRLAGAVVREKAGDAVIGTHLALCVRLDRPYLADVGFGDGLIEPTPIVEGAFRQDRFDFRLERVDDTWWRFHNQPYGGAPTFDFELSDASGAQLAERCHWLQTAPESGFVQNAVCQRYVDGELRILRGRVLKVVRGENIEQRTIDSAAEYRQVLAASFGIELSETARLWEKIAARHAEWLAAQQKSV